MAFSVVNNENGILNIAKANNTLLYGNLVNFTIKLEVIVQKINEIMDYEKSKTTLDTIYVTKKLGGVCKAYILFIR